MVMMLLLQVCPKKVSVKNSSVDNIWIEILITSINGHLIILIMPSFGSNIFEAKGNNIKMLFQECYRNSFSYKLKIK